MAMPGWAPLIVCDGVDVKCDIFKIIELVKNGIQDLVVLSTLLLVVVAVISGMKLVTSYNNPGALKETKAAFGKIITGYVVILAAWVVVYTIANALLKPEFFYFLSK